MANVIFYDEFKAGPGSIHIDPIQKNGSGSGKTAYIYSSSSRDPIFLQLTRKGTKMTAPFGISDGFGGNESGRNRKSLDVSSQDESLASCLELFEKYIVDYMTQHSANYFGKKKNRDSVQAMFHSCVKRSDQYRPLIRTKVNLGGKFATNFWKSTSNASVSRGSSVDLDKHIEVSVIVRLTSLWFASGRFGVIMDVHDLIYYPIIVPDAPLFLSDDGSLQYNEKNVSVEKTHTSENANPTVTDNENVILLSKEPLDYGAF